MWLRTMSTNSFAPDTPLQDVLPLNLWRLLARHDIRTVAQVEQLYPKKLWEMHYVGPVRFREIEKYLFSGKKYEPLDLSNPDVMLADGASLEGILPARVFRVLKRHRIETVMQLKAAYPLRLSEISGIGSKARHDVEEMLGDWATANSRLKKPDARR